jgi:hypothetical protein
MAGLSEKDLAAFTGSVTQVNIPGPCTLYRFSERPRGEGAWWIDQETFRLIYDEARDNSSRSPASTSGTEFRRLYRKYLAISFDWNDLMNLFRMDVPAHATVPVWLGTTRGQPMFSIAEQERLGRQVEGHLNGGLPQLFVEHYEIEWVRPISI